MKPFWAPVFLLNPWLAWVVSFSLGFLLDARWATNRFAIFFAGLPHALYLIHPVPHYNLKRAE